MCRNDKKLLKYELKLDLLEPVMDLPDSYLEQQSVGRVFLNLTKVDGPSRWKRLLFDNSVKPTNMGIWWAVYEKNENELDKFVKDKSTKDKSVKDDSDDDEDRDADAKEVDEDTRGVDDDDDEGDDDSVHINKTPKKSSKKKSKKESKPWLVCSYRILWDCILKRFYVS